MTEECEENKKGNEYRRAWPIECSGCLYRDREYAYEIGTNVECIHPIFSRKSYECPVRMTAMAKNKFGRKTAEDFI